MSAIGAKRTGRRRALDQAQASRVRWYYAKTDMSMHALALRFDVSHTAILRVINRKGPYADDPVEEFEQ